MKNWKFRRRRKKIFHQIIAYGLSAGELGGVTRRQQIPHYVPFRPIHEWYKSVESLWSYDKKSAPGFRRKKIADFSDMGLEKRVYLSNATAQKGKINTTLHHFDPLIDLAQKIENRFFKVCYQTSSFSRTRS